MYSAQGNYAEALKYYNQALSISEEKLGKDHPDTATTYNNMGVLFYNMEDYKSAKEYFEKAFAAFENVLGVNHPNTKITKRWLEDTIEKLNN